MLRRAPVTKPVFVDAEDGWAVRQHKGQEGSLGLARTTDGGRSWTTQPDPCFGPIGYATAVSFPTPSLGWVLCTDEPGAGQQQKGIFYSSDGASTWHPAMLTTWKQPVSTLGGYGYASGIQFFPSGRGWIVEADRGCLLGTFDAGQNWRCDPKTEPEVTSITSISFVSEQVGFALLSKRSDARLIGTTDGDRHWHAVKSWPTS